MELLKQINTLISNEKFKAAYDLAKTHYGNKKDYKVRNIAGYAIYRILNNPKSDLYNQGEALELLSKNIKEGCSLSVSEKGRRLLFAEGEQQDVNLADNLFRKSLTVVQSKFFLGEIYLNGLLTVDGKKFYDYKEAKQYFNDVYQAGDDFFEEAGLKYVSVVLKDSDSTELEKHKSMEVLIALKEKGNTEALNMFCTYQISTVQQNLLVSIDTRSLPMNDNQAHESKEKKKNVTRFCEELRRINEN
ncbi:MAG: hypothetical protein HAW67_02340 [Endozoicomonadaceae bacterium]|nr:hypothetical protein [Endozoicomonadaceae bacterium]